MKCKWHYYLTLFIIINNVKKYITLNNAYFSFTINNVNNVSHIYELNNQCLLWLNVNVFHYSNVLEVSLHQNNAVKLVKLIECDCLSILA